MPIIFAQALMFIPMFFSRFEATSAIGTAFSDYRGFWYNLVFGYWSWRSPISIQQLP